MTAGRVYRIVRIHSRPLVSLFGLLPKMPVDVEVEGSFSEGQLVGPIRVNAGRALPLGVSLTQLDFEQLTAELRAYARRAGVIE